MGKENYYLKKIEIDQSLLFEKAFDLDLFDLCILNAMKKIQQYNLQDNTIEFGGQVWCGILLKNISDLIPVVPRNKITFVRVEKLASCGLINLMKSPIYPVGFYYHLIGDGNNEEIASRVVD